MFDLAPLAIGTTGRSGPAIWLAEAVATFTLVLTILGGVRYAPQAVPWLVGLAITAAYWFTSSTSFANPAVTLARGFTTTFAGSLSITFRHLSLHKSLVGWLRRFSRRCFFRRREVGKKRSRLPRQRAMAPGE